MNKQIEDYPLVLTAEHLAEILALSKPTVYELMNHSSFPLIKIGRSKRVLKHEFFNWLSEHRSLPL